jgi:hypothetical protein
MSKFITSASALQVQGLDNKFRKLALFFED